MEGLERTSSAEIAGERKDSIYFTEQNPELIFGSLVEQRMLNLHVR